MYIINACNSCMQSLFSSICHFFSLSLGFFSISSRAATSLHSNDSCYSSGRLPLSLTIFRPMISFVNGFNLLSFSCTPASIFPFFISTLFRTLSHVTLLIGSIFTIVSGSIEFQNLTHLSSIILHLFPP